MGTKCIANESYASTLEIKGNGLTFRDLDIQLNGHKIPGLAGLTLSVESGKVNTALLKIYVDEIDIDVEELVKLEAKFQENQKAN